MALTVPAAVPGYGRADRPGAGPGGRLLRERAVEAT